MYLSTEFHHSRVGREGAGHDGNVPPGRGKRLEEGEEDGLGGGGGREGGRGGGGEAFDGGSGGEVLGEGVAGDGEAVAVKEAWREGGRREGGVRMQGRKGGREGGREVKHTHTHLFLVVPSSRQAPLRGGQCHSCGKDREEKELARNEVGREGGREGGKEGRDLPLSNSVFITTGTPPRRSMSVMW